MMNKNDPLNHDPADAGLSGIGSAGVGPLNHDPADAGSAGIDPTDADPANRTLAGIGLTNRTPTNRTPANHTAQNDDDIEERLSRLELKQSAKYRDLHQADVEYQDLRIERVVLVGVYSRKTSSETEAAESLLELEALANTAGAGVLGSVLQHRFVPDRSTYLGSGKLGELKALLEETLADTVIFDNELLPSQRRNIEDVVQVKVIDRTALILDIFAGHAKSTEGRAQVELAQLEYLLPRLRGWGASMSRQAGGQVGSGGAGGSGAGAGMGARGPGETRLELDRRAIYRRLDKLRRSLKKLESDRMTKRKMRLNSSLAYAVIVGYTNTGKSSLLRAITGEKLLVQNALFATLDTTTKRVDTKNGFAFLLSDTVGFISRLPTELVEAFRSTLEETQTADILIHVVDPTAGFAHEINLSAEMDIAPKSVDIINKDRVQKEIDAVHTVLEELGAGAPGAGAAGGGAPGAGSARIADSPDSPGSAGLRAAGSSPSPSAPPSEQHTPEPHMSAGHLPELQEHRRPPESPTSAPEPHRRPPELLVFNKMDLLTEDAITQVKALYPNAHLVSSKTGEGIGALVDIITSSLIDVRGRKELLIPYGQEAKLSRYYKNGQVISREDKADGIHVVVMG